MNVGTLLALLMEPGQEANPAARVIAKITWITIRKMEAFLVWLSIICLSSSNESYQNTRIV
ncbi:hypothetical protein ADM99_11680 [Leptolinea tardivitalis]|uniref:Uncharacterized protein n=1 Tax=Leptolinea tardivitalis TaxID=229920 RepID=A0A0N8GKY1_9CHLR|nr:hypothetical protein ADM99_11680 [Leptolinea tardivitalis]